MKSTHIKEVEAILASTLQAGMLRIFPSEPHIFYPHRGDSVEVKLEEVVLLEEV